MADVPQEAVTAAAAAIERELMSGTDYVTAPDSDEALARAAVEAAAPILAAKPPRDHPGVRLLEEALFLRTNGEYAPGGGGEWRDWDDKAERYLRGLLPPDPETA